MFCWLFVFGMLHRSDVGASALIIEGMIMDYNAERHLQEGYDKCKYEYSQGHGLSLIPRPALSAFGYGWCSAVIEIYNCNQMHRFMMEKRNGKCANNNH